jgi:histidine ammonia-lyase
MSNAEAAIPIDSNDSLDLAVAEAVGSGGRAILLTSEALSRIATGRHAFEQMLREPDRYVYGSSTAPGNRARTMLSAEAAQRQGGTLRQFITSRPGVGGRGLPSRVVRMAILARLANSLSGRGKLTVATAQAIAALLNGTLPEVPSEGLAGSGEVMALSWLLAPIADLPLAIGEAMALVNGSPVASAMIADVAITARRRLDLAEQVFALSAEAARIPLEHYSPLLSEFWPEATYAAALRRLSALLEGGAPQRLSHQAPVSWRIVPNIVAVLDSAINEAARVATNSLRALKDNPTMLLSGGDSSVVSVASSGGYHDHFAGRAIDTVNAGLADLCALASRQVSRLLAGDGLGLPQLLAPRPTDGVGTEYLSWSLTGPLARAQQAAAPAGLSISLEDPGGNQSDIAQPAFVAYERFRICSHALDECLATLAITATVALQIRGAEAPPKIAKLWRMVLAHWDPNTPTASASGEPLRALLQDFNKMGGGEG